MPASELERAQEFRRQQEAREENKLAYERALVGSQGARRALLLAFDPVRHWKGWDPIRRVLGDEK